MTPVLRVIISATNFAAAVQVGDIVDAQINCVGASVLSFVDYFTSNLVPPGAALYAALLDANGNVTVLVPTAGSYTPKIPHTFAGWPTP